MTAKNRVTYWPRFLVLGLAALVAVGVAIWAKAHAQGPMPDPQQVVVAFASGSCTITEGDSVTITVTLSNSSTQTVTVEYSVTMNGSGLQDQWTDTIQFNAGETSKSETFTILDDTCCQGTGTAQIVLGNPLGATLGSPSTITVTVLDNDTCP